MILHLPSHRTALHGFHLPCFILHLDRKLLTVFFHAFFSSLASTPAHMPAPHNTHSFFPIVSAVKATIVISWRRLMQTPHTDVCQWMIGNAD